MRQDIIETRLRTYTLATAEDETAALKEILQEIILYSLASTDFFNIAAFHGGTSLRILHELPRFSEDLDFVLKTPNQNFSWEAYRERLTAVCQDFGIEPEISDKSRADTTIQKMFLKDNSIGKLIDLNFKHHAWRKLRIKLEIDINPPAGSNFINRYINFPLDFAIVSQDLPSNFSGKYHALLARNYVKGRDWYDFIWYVKNGISPNLTLLSSALEQQGPWQNEKLEVNDGWLTDQLTQKIKRIDWERAREDVRPFLGTADREALKIWSAEFFEDLVSKMIRVSGNA